MLALSGALAGTGSAGLSTDGRYVTFASDAPDLVPDDTNRISDVFVRDLSTQTTERMSVTADEQADGVADGATISGDGRFVAFSSSASNLVPGDANGRSDVFVRDRRLRTLDRVSVGNDETEADDDSFALGVSADGRLVVFVSAASNLVPNDPAGSWKYFARDRVAGTTERVDVRPDGTVTAGELRRDIRAAVSADGRYVAFVSGGLPPSDGLYVRDRVGRTTQRVAAEIDRLRTVSLSDDGRLFAFAAVTLPRSVVVVDLPTGSRDTVSRAIDGAPANGESYDAALSADGRYVAFTSYASNLVSGDTNGRADAFVHDRRTGRTERVSVSSGELEGTDDSFDAQMTADGRYVAFGSQASNLVEGDQNGRHDVFVRDRQLGTTELVSVRGQAPRVGSVRLLPRRPRAGRPLAATIALTHAGRPLLTATIRCGATVAGRRLTPVSAGFSRGTGRCAWRVPKDSRTKPFRGTMTAVTTTGTVTRSFAQAIR